MLNTEQIAGLVTMYPCYIKAYETLASTNTTAKEFATAGAPEGTVIIAEAQTSGKGRMGRHFFSPDKSGLYMSVILRPRIAPSSSLLITTAAAVAVAEALSAVTNKNEIWIKWVNDIFYGDLKVCGILTEAAFSSDTSSIDYAVLGIGVNLFYPANGFPEELKGIAGALEITRLSREELSAQIINNFYKYYEELEKKLFLNTYRSYMRLTGQRVIIISQTFIPGDAEIHGTHIALTGDVEISEAHIALTGDDRYSNNETAVITGITDDFHLLVRFDDGRVKELSSGEIATKNKGVIYHG